MPVSVIIPAYQAADSIAATVTGARALPGVGEVIVVDDGSQDATSARAREAGADRVLTLPRNLGKGGALTAGIAAATGETLLFLDADLGDSAAQAGDLVTAAGTEAMSIAVFPRRPGAGGFGFAKGLATHAIQLFSGLTVTAPLSGQRALPAAVARRVGMARRFAIETALTIEAAHLGVPIVEQPVSLDHHHTGRDASGFRHRFRQFRDILRFVLPLGYGLAWPALSSAQVTVRALVWLAAFAALLCLWSSWVLAGSVVAATLLWLPSLWVSAVTLGSRKRNYLGRSLPGAAGLLLPLIGLPAVWLSPLAPNLRFAATITLGAFGTVGLIDDLLARRGRQARGLRGHFRALREGRLTTGAVKAMVGLVAGLAAAAVARPIGGAAWEVIVDGLLIALCANLLNLLDLRPGRALKGFVVLAAPAMALDPRAALLLTPLLAAAIVYAPSDLAGRVMMGDVGANTLGGAAGLGLALALPPLGRLVAVLALVAVHVYCERASLTQTIARSPVLRFLDGLGTRHLPPLDEGEGA